MSKPRCTATSKQTGEQCKMAAIDGLNVCRYHGANTRARTAARQRIQRAAAAQAVATFGLPVDIDPDRALLEELARTHGHVLWLAAMVAELDPDEITWGLRQTEKGWGPEGPIDKTTEQAAPSVWIDLYQKERKHLVEVAKACVAAGIVARQMQLAEQQGELVAQVLRGVFGDPELSLTPDQMTAARKVASRHLRAIDTTSEEIRPWAGPAAQQTS